MAYARSPFWVFESYLINVLGLNENIIQLILKQSSLSFVTSELSPGI